MVPLLLSLVLAGLSAQQYRPHETPINYEVPHELIFQDQRCWSDSEVNLPDNCTLNYCSRCYFNPKIVDYRTSFMSYNDNRLVVGAMDTVLAFDVTDNLFDKIQTVRVEPTSRATCIGEKDKKDASCRNYYRLMLPLNPPGSLLTCGTNAYDYDRACQIRMVKDLAMVESTMDGTGVVSQNEGAWSTAFIADSRIFAGVMVPATADAEFFVLTSAKIGQLDTGKGFTSMVSTSSTWLKRPKFVASFSNGDYAYFFFQELEYTELVAGTDKNVVVSRIARVCREDGGANVGITLGLPNTQQVWRTFVKARIYCENKVDDSTFGTQSFKYNRIGDAVLDTSSGKRVLYAAFSAGDTSAAGSVICSYDMDQVDKDFDTSNYRDFTGPVTDRPRQPPTCSGMANTTNSDRNLVLRSTDVTPSGAPLFLQSGLVFTKLLLDTNIGTNSGRNSSDSSSYPVLFIGTNTGAVLKVTWVERQEGVRQPILVESLQVAIGMPDSDLSVKFLAFEKTNDPSYLFVGTGVSVAKVIISRCLRIPNLSQTCCYASRDPYCGWCPSGNICTSRTSCGSNWIAAITAEYTDTCPGREESPQLTTPSSTLKESSSTEAEGSTSRDEHTKSDTVSTAEFIPDNPTTAATITAAAFSTPAATSAVQTESTGADPREEQIKDEKASWKTVAIVMAILCSIFLVISVILAFNLLRRWCASSKKQPGLSHPAHKNAYNPLSAGQNDYPARIPVFQQNNNKV